MFSKQSQKQKNEKCLANKEKGNFTFTTYTFDPVIKNISFTVFKLQK